MLKLVYNPATQKFILHDAPENDPDINAYLRGVDARLGAIEELKIQDISDNLPLITKLQSAEINTYELVFDKNGEITDCIIYSRPENSQYYVFNKELKNWVFVPLQDAKSAKMSEIANARWQSETGGTTLNGIEIATDSESQAMITGAALQAVVDPNYTCRWKTAQGFISLSATEIVGIAQAVRSHVQNCFDREAALLSAIDAAETVEAVMAVAWEA